MSGLAATKQTDSALSFGVGVVVVLLFLVQPAMQGSPTTTGRQSLEGHVPKAVESITAIDHLPATNRLNLAISLPLRNQDELNRLLQRQYDPASPDFRHWLTPEQFAEAFGPTKDDYRSLIEFAQKSGFEVVGTHPNRTLLDVRAPVSDIERCFHVELKRYQHPTEDRVFFAPNAEPSCDFAAPLLHVSGLDKGGNTGEDESHQWEIRPLPTARPSAEFSQQPVAAPPDYAGPKACRSEGKLTPPGIIRFPA